MSDPTCFVCRKHRGETATAWYLYQEQRASHGPACTQLIIRSADERSTAGDATRAAIGNAFVALLPDGYTFGKWQKPEGRQR